MEAKRLKKNKIISLKFWTESILPIFAVQLKQSTTVP
jgi:hypothetical protein